MATIYAVGESTTIRQKVSLLINAVSRCPAAEHDFQTTPFRQSDNFSISVYLREIVDFIYKGIFDFARIAMKLSSTVLNLLRRFLSPLSMQMSASDLEIICVFAVTAGQDFQNTPCPAVW